MNILFLAPYLPSPPNTGARRRAQGLMSSLARSHTVSVLSLVEPGVDHTNAIRQTRDYCAEVVAVANRRFTWNTLRKRGLQAASLLSPFSYGRLLHHQPQFQAALDRMVSQTRYDIITVESALLGYYRFPTGTTIVLDEHNIEFDILRRTAMLESRRARKFFNAVDYRKLRREERAVWNRVHGCAVPSERDEQLLRLEKTTIPTMVVPNGIDSEFFRPVETAPDPQLLVFFGVLSYYPNEDGLTFFLDAVWPLIKRRHPALKFLIVGPAPPASLLRRANDDVIITGMVDDVRPYLARASAIVAPLRIGGGTRLKILEALAMGKATVSTTIGAEGLDVTDGRELLLADTAPAFAEQVGRVIEDEALARRLGAAGRALVEERYGWHSSARKLEDLYRAAMAHASSGARPEVGEGGPGRMASGPLHRVDFEERKW
jgi:glycosyltransferase involved in cell wall biosynthesis